MANPPNKLCSSLCHFLFFPFVSYIFIFLQLLYFTVYNSYGPRNRPMPTDIHPLITFTLFYLLFYIFLILSFFLVPKIQTLRRVRWVFYGQAAMSWLTGVLIYAHEESGHKVPTLVTIAASYVIASFYTLSALWPVSIFIRIPEEKRAFSTVNRYVIVIGVAHALAAAAVFWYLKRWELYAFPIFASFIFLCDAYSCSTINQYSLCIFESFPDREYVELCTVHIRNNGNEFPLAQKVPSSDREMCDLLKTSKSLFQPPYSPSKVDMIIGKFRYGSFVFWMEQKSALQYITDIVKAIRGSTLTQNHVV